MVDMTLEDRILTALLQSPFIPEQSLRFEATQGRVTLRGVVRTYYQKQMAQESLRHLPGVDEIANKLEVRR